MSFKRPPNVVLIFADDMGWGDPGCYGGTRGKTPNLDALAKSGVRFTDFSVPQPVCSASRAGLLTGCYPGRVGIQGALGPGSKIGISSGETTLAELARSAGLATGMVGKWHLGHQPEFDPTRHGFDEWLGLPYSNDMWPFHPDTPGAYPPLPLRDGEKTVEIIDSLEKMGTLTTRYTERAVQFIERNRARPFFLYFAHSMPHVPLAASAMRRGKSPAGLYGDVMEEIDASVGDVLGALKRCGIERETLVVFTSDNGPWLPYGEHSGSAGPLREGKGTCWEGGIREPMIANWPGKTRPGAVIREPAMTIDLLPTLARLWGVKLPQSKIDGADILPLILGDERARNPRQDSFYYFNSNELQAVRSGDWKLLLPQRFRTLGAHPKTARNGARVPDLSAEVKAPQLYNLRDDLRETTDLAARRPDVLARLLALAERAREDLGDGPRRLGRSVRPPGRVS